ncbi:hypothetical protein SDC9_62059 [bioreactor metagenome]|uniref:Uncharacterized protein n=1 Tax=bioreactor metagenome TaxID=1076179 RepID=A0A644XIS6_9ZZZZ
MATTIFTEVEIQHVYAQLGLSQDDCDLEFDNFCDCDLHFYGLTKDFPIGLSGSSIQTL